MLIRELNNKQAIPGNPGFFFSVFFSFFFFVSLPHRRINIGLDGESAVASPVNNAATFPRPDCELNFINSQSRDPRS